MTPEWPAPATVRALSSFRHGGGSAPPYQSLHLGDHVGDKPSHVAENRRRRAAAAGLPAAPKWLTQVHGSNVADLDAAPSAGAAGGVLGAAGGRFSAHTPRGRCESDA